MAEEITFIHAADLHLDSPFKGLMELPGHLIEPIQNSTFQALDQLVEAAIQNNVDFILITGDLFDNEKQSLKAQIRLRTAFEKLKEHGISVYLSYGNHDYINGNIHQVTYPDNVRTFPDEKVRSFEYEKNGESVAEIYGFSYENRAVTDNKAVEFTINNREIPFHIAMLHGSIQGNSEHEPYAPFHLSELVSKEFDYWALGHIHKRSILKEDPHVVYPGNIQGRHRKETGKKGCYLVHMTAVDTELTFIPLQAIEFTPISMDVSHCESIFEVEKQILHTMKDLENTGPKLLDVTLTSDKTKLRTWHTGGELEDLIEIINESLANYTPWQYIFRTDIEVGGRLELHEATYGEHFLGELEKSFNETEGIEYLKELFHHRQARKYLELPDEVEDDWKKEAQNRLMDQLLKGGGR